MKHIPRALIYARLFIGVLILAGSIFHIAHYNIIAVLLFSLGLLTDIFDGIIARRMNISTQYLRRLDSTVDQVFFILVAAATFAECPQFFYANHVKLIILLSAEAAAYIICFLKFRKEVAIHAISSKIWTLVLFATLVQIMFTCNAGLLFQVCFYAGMLTRLEIIVIVILLRKWTNDVPSFYHAILLRQGKPIKRNKLFNG
ncbi:MAG: CDP-alcohol phosphatidyltransferase family protein [Chitinophagaceae bacterium]